MKKKVMVFFIKQLNCILLNLRKKNLFVIPDPLYFLTIYRYLSIFGYSHGFSGQNAETNILNRSSITHSVAVGGLALGFGFPVTNQGQSFRVSVRIKIFISKILGKVTGFLFATAWKQMFSEGKLYSSSSVISDK